MKASLTIVTRKLACHFQKKSSVLVSLWTTITMPFVRTSYPDMPPGAALLEDSSNSIVVVGGCPVCRVGVLEYCFTCLGIFLAIVLFPFGFLCCFALRKRRCPNCGVVFT